MDPAYPHYDDPERFTAWFYGRLKELSGIQWDESLSPIHSSYGDWWAWGAPVSVTPLDSPSATSSNRTPTSSRPESPSSPARPTLPSRQHSSRRTSADRSWAGATAVAARVSRHGLRLERQYQLARSHVAENDPDGRHYVRPLQLLRLPPRHAGEPPLSVIVYINPGPNALRDVITCGPAYFAASAAPTLKKWTPGLDASGNAIKPISITKFLDFAIGACESLEVLHHGNRLVHGEIRADSFHFDLDSSTVRLINLGSGVRSLADGLSSAGWSTLTREYGVEHKLNYVAPEMTGRLPAAPDLRTDIYSLGVLFYHMLTGELPFTGSNALEVLQQVLSRRVPLLTSKRNDVPDCLSAVIQKMVQKNIEDRYHSMSGIKWDLEQIQRFFDEGDKNALASFKISTHDVNSFFTLPNIQIGRDVDRERIFRVLDRTTRRRNKSVTSKRMSSPRSSRSSASSETDSMGARSRMTPILTGAPSTSTQDSFTQLPPTVNEDNNINSSGSDSAVRSNEPLDKRLSLETNSRNSLSSSLEGSNPILRSATNYKRRGLTEVITVSGAPGLGKSSLLQSVWTSARGRGYVATSKFDQVRRTPFEAVLAVMKSLFRQIFSESDLDSPFHVSLRAYVRPVWNMLSGMLDLPDSLLDGYNHVQNIKLDTNLAHNNWSPSHARNGSIAPTLGPRRLSGPGEQRICGGQGQTVSDFLRTGASSKSSRFMAVFTDVLRFLSSQQLLILVLDDLQFADEESVDLLSGIINAKIPLVMILTYRFKDQLPPKVLSLFADIPSLTDIALTTLREEDVAEYVAATLHRSRDYIFPLVAVIYEKTHGNPFFMKEMLETSYRKGCISYCWREGKWSFDLDKIFKEFSSSAYGDQMDNNFIVSRLNELSTATRSFLAWASLLGTTFSFPLAKALMLGQHPSAHPRDLAPNHIDIPIQVTLNGTEPTKLNSKISQAHRAELPRQSSQDALRGLQGAIDAYIVMPGEDDTHFRWCHDRYQTAATSLIDKKHVASMHFAIAQLLMETTEFDEGDNVWTRASHICASTDIILERVTLRARYRDALFQAAEKANESGGRAAGLNYLTNALTLLQRKDPWDDDSQADVSYAETLQLFSKTAECYYHQNFTEPALQLLSVVFRRARTPSDMVPAKILQSRIIARRGDNAGAVRVLAKCLGHLDVEVPSLTWEQCDDKFRHLKAKIEGSDLEDIFNRPLTKDEKLVTIASVLIEALVSAFWTDALLFYQLALLEVELALERGTSTSIALAFIHMGSCAIGRFDEVEFGCRMGSFAHRLIHKYRQDTYTFGRTLTLYCKLLGHFSSPLKDALYQLQQAMEACLVAGDRFGALNVCGFLASAQMWCSHDLVEIENYCAYGAEEIHDWQDDVRGGIYITSVRQAARALQGKTFNRSPTTILSDGHHDTNSYLQFVKTRLTNPVRAETTYYAYMIEVLFLFGYYKEAAELGDKTIGLLREYWSARFSISVPFFWSLAQLAMIRDNNPDPDREEFIISEVRRHHGRVRKWSAVNDVNFVCWDSIIKAQLQEHEQKYGASLQSYEQALDHAEVNELHFEYGLCSELYGEYMIRRGAKRPAKYALEESIAYYRRISAFGKAEQVSEKHEWLLRGTASLHTQDASTQTMVGAEALVPVGHHDMPHTSEPERKHGHHPDEAASSNGTGTGDLAATGLDMIDLTGILKSSQVLASELQTEKLFFKMCRIILDSTSAEFCAIIVSDDDNGWCLGGYSDAFGNEIDPGQSLEQVESVVGKQIALFSIRFRETVYLKNIFDDPRFSNVSEAYRRKHPEGRAVISMPIVRGEGMILGCCYLEGPSHTLTERNVNVVRLLVNSLGISISNAKLFKKVEKVSASNEAIVEAQKQALARTKASEIRAKASENEAKAAVRRAEEAARAKSAFLANVSHELRTPLNGVIGMSELLKGSKLTSEQEGYADSIRVCADTLLTVINDILDFSKLEAGKMQMFPVPLSLTETFEEVVRALSFSGLGKELETVVDIKLRKDLLVMSDPVRLHQILMNLLSNAYKFTPKGSVTVSAVSDMEDEKEIRVTCTVADTGIGISEESKAKLFLPFSQGDSSTARSYGGTGLGLSICRAIITNVMGGKIWLESKEGEGTKVSFTLTLEKVARKDGKTKSSNDPMAIYSPTEEGFFTHDISPDLKELAQVPRNQLRVLIAEDNPVNSKIAQQFVKRLGLQAEAYGDGQQAVDALTSASTAGKPFHVVLMDVQMPVLDGYDATRAIRKHDDAQVRRVLIIAMTASAIRGDRERCLEAGMNNYLAKPVRQQVLSQMLDSYLNNDVGAIPSTHRDSIDSRDSEAVRTASKK